MRNTIPDYIADSGNLVLNIILTTVFAVIFIAVYTLFSQTIWFDLHDETRFLLTAGFISASELLLIISNTVLFYRHREKPLSTILFAAWIFLEIFLIAAMYSGIAASIACQGSWTGTYFPHWISSFLKTYPKAFLLTGIAIGIPYAATAAMAAARDRNIARMKAEEAAETTEPVRKNKNLIDITDYNGNLKISINISNLLYIESEDNYIKVHYTTQGKIRSHLVRCKIKTIEEKFSGSGRLIRCHRSYVVNPNKIKEMRKHMNNYSIILDENGTGPIPVSKKYFESFRSFLKNE